MKKSFFQKGGITLSACLILPALFIGSPARAASDAEASVNRTAQTASYAGPKAGTSADTAEAPSAGLKKGEALKKGDCIGITAPASYIPNNDFNQTVTLLRKLGFKVKVMPSCTSRDRYFAGSDQQRAQDINDLFEDDSVDAIMCLRGGYGCARILDYLDYDMIAAHPKLLIGYSDVTALQIVLMERCGLSTVSGPMASSLNGIYSQYAQDLFLDIDTAGLTDQDTLLEEETDQAAEAGAEARAETGIGSDRRAETGSGIGVGTRVDAGSGIGIGTRVEAGSGISRRVRAGTNAQTEVMTEAETEPETEAETEAETEKAPQTEPESEPETEPEKVPSEVELAEIKLIDDSIIDSDEVPVGDTAPAAVDYTFSQLVHGLTSNKPIGEIELPKGKKLKTLIPGTAQGVIIGGNLTVIASLAGTEYELQGDHALLFFEEVNETAYRIDRMLRQLYMNGLFDRVDGILIGEMTNTRDQNDYTVEQVLEEYARLAGKPCITGIPAGHGACNMFLPFGVTARMTANEDGTAKLEILEAALR